MSRSRKAIAGLALALALLVPTAAIASPASAAPRRGQHSAAIDWLADQIALTSIDLGPGAKRLVNKLLKAATPVLCPIVAKLAAPAFAPVVEQGCLSLGTAPDPWVALQQFTPLLCGNPGLFFPDYEQIFVLACKFLV